MARTIISSSLLEHQLDRLSSRLGFNGSLKLSEGKALNFSVDDKKLSLELSDDASFLILSVSFPIANYEEELLLKALSYTAYDRIRPYVISASFAEPYLILSIKLSENKILAENIEQALLSLLANCEDLRA